MPRLPNNYINIPGYSRPVHGAEKIDGAPSFTWAEATKIVRVPETKKITWNIVHQARELQHLKEELSKHLGYSVIFTVTSWYRPPAVNRAVGGVENSLHLTGLATDVKLSGTRFKIPSLETAELIRRWYSGGIGYYPINGGWFHLSSKEGIEAGRIFRGNA